MMMLFPNPTTGVITLEISRKPAATLQVAVFTIHGQLVKYYENLVGLPFIFDLSDCRAGDYMVRVYTSGKVFSREIELLPKPVF